MRRFFLGFLTLLIISCNNDSDTYSVKGNAAGFEDGTTIIFYEVGGDNSPISIDTLEIMNGKFEGHYAKSDDVTVNYLHVENTNSNLVYFPENEDLQVTLYKDSLTSSFASGSKLNDAYTVFSKKIRAFNLQKQDNVKRFKQARQEGDNLAASQIQQNNASLNLEEVAYKKQFISENTNSLFAAMLASEMLTRKEITGAEATAFVNKFSPKVAQSKLARGITRSVSLMKASDVGGTAPDFEAPTPTGEMLSLKETMGKYTIIDFWASWCRPCRAENPNVVSVYNKYHDKGLNIISVSLDRAGQKDRWIQAIEDDKMDWYHVSNLKFWQDPIAKAYQVRSIPATFLIDENGTIVAKNLRGRALHTKIASLFGGQ